MKVKNSCKYFENFLSDKNGNRRKKKKDLFHYNRLYYNTSKLYFKINITKSNDLKRSNLFSEKLHLLVA